MASEERRRHLERLVNEHVLTAPGGREAYEQDPQHHAETSLIRSMVTAADLAMEIEGIPRGSRDRVIHTLVSGEPPYSPGWPDPEEARQRIANHAAAVETAKRQPAKLTFCVDESGNIKRKEDQP